MGIKSPTGSCTALRASSVDMSVETRKGALFCRHVCGNPQGGSVLSGLSTQEASPLVLTQLGSQRNPMQEVLLLSTGSPHAAAPLLEWKAGFLMMQCFPRVGHKPSTQHQGALTAWPGLSPLGLG